MFVFRFSVHKVLLNSNLIQSFRYVQGSVPSSMQVINLLCLSSNPSFITYSATMALNPLSLCPLQQTQY